MKVPPPCCVIGAILTLLWTCLSPASEITDRYARFLLIANGDGGSGSASIVKFRGNTLILTNAHVISGNMETRFRLLNSHEIKAELLGVAQDRDLVVARQSALTDGIEASEAVDKEVSIGDEVVVLGNSQGSSVVTEIAGKVTGIGPDLLEVDARFVPGNSGSPIIHVKSGKVIAVATFVTLKKLDAVSQDSSFNEVRRFGYRIDTVLRWQFCLPDRFAAEGIYLLNVQEHTSDLVTLVKDLRDDGMLDPENYSGKRGWVSGYVATFGKGWPDDRLKQLKFSQTTREFTTHINSDIQGINPAVFTTYHREILQRELAMRALVARYFENVQWNTVRFEGWGPEAFVRPFNTFKNR